MNITKRIKIDLAQRGANPVIDAVRGEQESRKIIFELYDNGQKFEQEIKSVNISFETQQKTGGTYNALEDGNEAFSVNGNEVEITLARQVTAVEGRTKIVVSLFGDIDTKLCTFPCVVDVAPNPELDNLNPQNYYNIIDLLNSVITAGEGIKIEGGVISVTNVTGGGSVEVQGVSGENYIEDLPLGLSYAADNAELKFLTNVETGEEAKLSISSGACIVKTMQKLQTDAESLDAAAVYVLYGNKVEIDDEGKETVVIMEQLVPSYDYLYCGVSYSIHKTVKGESNSAGSEIDTSNFVSKDNVVTEFDPKDPDNNNYIPSVQALVDYVAGLSFEGGQTLTAGEGIRIENGIISLAIENAEGGSY